MDGDDFTFPYILDKITNSPAGHQLPKKSKNVQIISIYVQEPITNKGALSGLQHYQTKQGKYKAKIFLCRRKIYQLTDIETLWSRLYRTRPVVSHLEVILPQKHKVPKIIVEAIKVTQFQLWKEALFVKYYKKNNVNIL